MLAKLIVTGATRDEALARARRALAEFQVEGLATVIPFHRAIVYDPAFIGDGDHLRRLHQVDRDRVGQHRRAVHRRRADSTRTRPLPRQNVVVEVGGRRVEVSLPGQFSLGGGGVPATARSARSRRPRKRGGAARRRRLR